MGMRRLADLAASRSWVSFRKRKVRLVSAGMTWFSRRNVLGIGIVGTVYLAHCVHAGNAPFSLPSMASLGQCMSQTADPLLKKGKEVAETIDKVSDAIRSNWEAIVPLVVRLQETAKIDSIPALYHKFAVDVPQRMAELADVAEMLDKPGGDWKNVTDRIELVDDEKACRIALAAYGPIILGPMGLIPLTRMPLPTDLGVDHYRYCIHEFTGIAEKDVVFVSRESTIMGEHSTAALNARLSFTNQEAEGLFCPLFFVAIDHEAKRIVLSIRGTLSVADVMTDCIAGATEFPAAGEGAMAHAGMVKAAELVRERAGPALEAAAAASGYCSLLVTGHSLGGAVAHLLAISLAQRPWFPSSPPRPAANLPPSIRHISAVAFGPPPYLSVRALHTSSGLLGLPAMQLPALRLPWPRTPAPTLTPPALPLPGPLHRLAPPSLRRPTLTLRSFVDDLDIVPRLSLHGAEIFAAFIAGEGQTPQEPELFLLSEVVLVREEQGRMRFLSLSGTDALLSSRALLGMLLGFKQSKPMTDHLPDKYDKILRELRPQR